MKKYEILSFCLLAAVAFPALAHAYVDPGAGSMLLQLLLGGMAGLYVFLKIFKQKIFRFFGSGKDAGKE